MKKLFYPAVFHPEDTGYSVSVPDIDGCFSEGDSLKKATELIFDAIGLCLEDCKDFPNASLPVTIAHEQGDFVVLVPFDTLSYQRKHITKEI